MNKFGIFRFPISAIGVCLILFGNLFPTNAQNGAVRTYSLEQAVTLVQANSPATRTAANSLLSKYWSFRTYKSNYLPQLSFNATLPDYNHSIEEVTQPDGSIGFRARSVANYSNTLQLKQAFAPTGASISVYSDLYRLDNLTQKTTNFSGAPAQIGISQPLFQYNQLKWDRKLEPVKYEEARRQYNEDMEFAAVQVTAAFFDLLNAQVSEENARKNMAATDTVFKIAQGRYNLGKIAENELLQIELNLMRSRQSVSQSQLSVLNFTLKLKNLLGLTDKDPIELIPPSAVPELSLESDKAIAEARKNRAITVGYKRKLIEADQQVAAARGNSGFSGNLNGSYGLNKSSSSVNDIYNSPLNSEKLSLSLQIPIVDWGRTRSIRKTAQAGRELVRTQVSQAELNFDQDIFLLVQQYKMGLDNLKLATRADEIAQKRYEITKQRFLIGKINITDLNIAMSEKDAARLDYIAALRNAWNYHYEVRHSTLYDFQQDKAIVHGTEYD